MTPTMTPTMTRQFRIALSCLLLAVLMGAETAGAATFQRGAPHSTNNDDSCDIALLPAATLLLPYFEVDLSASGRETTVFTVINTSDQEQVAHVTLWTDYGFPAVFFSIYLTGYDVQGINLYDVIALGEIAPRRGTGYEDAGSPEGNFSSDNPAVRRNTCRNLPMQVHPEFRTRMHQAFTLGRVPALGQNVACSRVGSVHARAVGYATIDVASECSNLDPEEDDYYTKVLLFDNVLTGDYHQVDPQENYAQSGPLVHIRAIPEGGTGATRAAAPDQYKSNLERTFYSRYAAKRGQPLDARQPLPSTFAARWISGGAGDFQTSYKIWREGVENSDAGCLTYSVNGAMDVAEIVRFDEDENSVAHAEDLAVEELPQLAATSRVSVKDTDIFPPMENAAVAGWIYLNLDHDPNDQTASQAWVVTSMRSAGRFSVDSEAIALGNGCSPPAATTELTRAGGLPIGPAPNHHLPPGN